MLVEIYTDGSCMPNPGNGGWAAILICGDKRKEILGGQLDTTNNRMEINAVIEGLLVLKKPCVVKIYTDSQYVINGATKWIMGWEKNKWKNKEGKEIKNSDLWKKLMEISFSHKIEFEWVRAHNGHPINEAVDQLAKDGIKLASKF